MPHEAFSGEETSPHLLKADSLFNQKSIHLRVVVGVLVASLTGLILVGPLGCICTCNLLIWCNFQFSSITFISAGGDSLCSLTPSPLPFEKKLYCDLKQHTIHMNQNQSSQHKCDKDTPASVDWTHVYQRYRHCLLFSASSVPIKVENGRKSPRCHRAHGSWWYTNYRKGSKQERINVKAGRKSQKINGDEEG